MTNLLWGASGSAALLNLPAYLAAAKRALGVDVRLVLTPAAACLSRPKLLGGFCDVYLDEDSAGGYAQGSHVALAEWADCMVVLPATANTIGCIAHGLGLNLLSNSALAFPNQLLIFPNMNAAMWDNPAVKRNVDTLRGDGHYVHAPSEVHGVEVATGDIGAIASAPDPSVVVSTIAGAINQRPSEGGVLTDHHA